MRRYELVIVGGGPAGLAAAIAAADRGARNILLLERDQYLGGILNQCIHPGFGLQYFREELTGPEYAARFIAELPKYPQIEISRRSFAVKVTARKEITYLKPGCCETIKAGAVIMATGCRERTREMIHIPGDRPAGVFSAGLAQKLLNIEGLLPGKEVVIIGSGDIGLIMARRLTLEGARVKAVLEIQEKSAGLTRNVVQCLEDFNIPLYLRHQVLKISGRGRVAGVTVLNMQENKTFELACDTVLVSVGLLPERDIFADLSGLPGLFVCGNADKVYDLVDNVTRDSKKTGFLAVEYLRSKNAE
ncbi:MAG: NAD(P)/FAD-dependent oxidoreductase [Candidatus Margulisbacteria bacterium]|nr:NAD(P)/FAD-dependent oxidoreductase [Candidatus Margulisiibacteriota bacterium]